jgi:hypothetical protein
MGGGAQILRDFKRSVTPRGPPIQGLGPAEICRGDLPLRLSRVPPRSSTPWVALAGHPMQCVQLLCLCRI